MYNFLLKSIAIHKSTLRLLADLKIMLLLPYLWVSLCAAAALSESVLQPSQLGDGLAKAPIASPELVVPSNTSVLLSNVSSPSGNTIKVACDSSRYGKNLKVKSCRQLFGYVRKDTTQFTFAQRNSGIPHDLPLPLRTYSGETILLNIDSEPILAKDSIVGHASSSEVGYGAFTMLQACVIERGMGGLAFNLGGDNKVNVVIADYKPNVRCDISGTDAPEWDSCVSVFTNMRASKKLQVFGASDDEAVEEELPLVLEAADGKCQVAIDIVGKDTFASWYEIWESVTALTSICTRAKHSGGKAKGLGLHKNIFLELSTKKPYPRNQVAGWQNVSFANGSAAMRNFLALSPGPDYSDFRQGTGFELVAPVPDDGSSLVTSTSEPSANLSQLAIE